MMEKRICDDVQYRYTEGTQMLYIGLSNDDSYYKDPARAAKYDFGRNPDKEEKKVKLLKGIYREPYLDGWKYTINGKVHPLLVETVIRYAEYGSYTDEDGKSIVFTYLRHNRKALGIHYLIERYLAGGSTTDFYDALLRPYFPSPDDYEGYNPNRFIGRSSRRIDNRNHK